MLKRCVSSSIDKVPDVWNSEQARYQGCKLLGFLGLLRQRHWQGGPELLKCSTRPKSSTHPERGRAGQRHRLARAGEPSRPALSAQPCCSLQTMGFSRYVFVLLVYDVVWLDYVFCCFYYYISLLIELWCIFHLLPRSGSWCCFVLSSCFFVLPFVLSWFDLLIYCDLARAEIRLWDVETRTLTRRKQ